MSDRDPLSLVGRVELESPTFYWVSAVRREVGELVKSIHSVHFSVVGILDPND